MRADRMFTPQTSGVLSKITLTREELKEALQIYYELRGWTSDGIPIRSTLIDLDVGWAWDYL